MAHPYENEEDAEGVAEFSPDSQLWWRQVEDKIEQSIAEYTQSLWDRLQDDAGLQAFQQRLRQSQVLWQDGQEHDPSLAPEVSQKLLNYLEQQKRGLRQQLDQLVEQGKNHLRVELTKLRGEIWSENQKKINQMIQPSYQLITQKLSQNRQQMEQEWQRQRDQLGQKQTQMLQDLEGQIHQKLKPIIKHLEQELQYSYNLRERIRSVLTQFEGLIKDRTQKAWQKIDDIVKKQQDDWQQHNQQLSTRLRHWSDQWIAEEEQQLILLQKSRTFSQQLTENIQLFQQQISEPRKTLWAEGKRILEGEIRQLVAQLRQAGVGQEARIKTGVQQLLDRWQTLVSDFSHKQQHFSDCLLEASQSLKQQQNRLLSIKALQDKEGERLEQFKNQLFDSIGRASVEVQQQLAELRLVTDRGLQQIDQLLRERLQLVDEQLLAAEASDRKRLESISAQSQEFSAQLYTELNQKYQQQQQQCCALIEARVEQLSSELEGQFDQRILQLQKRLNQRQETLESEQRLLQGELLTRLQKECLVDLDQHREYLRSEFNLFEQNYQGRIGQVQAAMQQLEQQSDHYKETFVNNYRIGYNQLNESFEQQSQQLLRRLAELKAQSELAVGEARVRMEALQGEVDQRLTSFSQRLDEDLLRASARLQQQSREAVNELRSEQKELQQRVRETSERVEQQRKGMIQQIGDSTSLLEQQISDIERRQQDYLSNSVLLDRAEQMRRELLDNVDYLRKEGELISRIRLQVNDVREDLTRNNRLSDEIISRLKNFQQKEIELNQVESKLQQMFKMSEGWEQRWQLMKESQQQLENFQQRSVALDRLHQQTTELLHVLSDDAEKLQQERRVSEQQRLQTREVEEKISDLRRRIVPLESNFRRLNVLETSIGQQQVTLEALTVRAESLQATLDGIDQRIDKVYQVRDFIGRTETRVEELGEQLKGRLQALEQVTTQPKGEEQRAPDSDTRNTVIQLSQKGWTKKEIARATRLSIGAVELILELAPRK